MSRMNGLADRDAFAERIRLQLTSRYRGASVEVDHARFALHVIAPGIDSNLPLTPLHHASPVPLGCLGEPERAPALITEYVGSVERQLTPRTGTELSTRRLVWCVRTRAYLGEMARASDLLVVDIANTLSAFVAEDLPGSIMRGVPRAEWDALGLSDDEVRVIASANTAERFGQLVQRIHTIERIPADGWRMAGDVLYQGSVLMAPPVLG